jgi:hypothetical protein
MNFLLCTTSPFLSSQEEHFLSNISPTLEFTDKFSSQGSQFLYSQVFLLSTSAKGSSLVSVHLLDENERFIAMFIYCL